jgi:hypothetical protein
MRWPAQVALALLAGWLGLDPTWAAEIPVDNARKLAKAMREAEPGDTITLAPGTYVLQKRLRAATAGTADRPITVRASGVDDAVIEVSTTEGINVSAPYWRFENLDMVGVCDTHSACEHAFHIVGDADGVVVAGSRLRDFNAAIKGNVAKDESGEWATPDHVIIEGNEIFNAIPRETDNPVTTIDVVGGEGWIVRDNLIHDFGKAGGNGVSYAAFLKGNSKDGLFERNVVLCSWLHEGGTRVGLSFGGGGGSGQFCLDGCPQLHRDGVMRNNLIAFCSDAGIYLNRARDVAIHNNTLYRTGGIEARFEDTVADIRNNALDGPVATRDGATVFADANAAAGTEEVRSWFADPDALDFGLRDGAPLLDAADPGVVGPADDLCGSPRDGAPDIGAIEYPIASPCPALSRFAPFPVEP